MLEKNNIEWSSVFKFDANSLIYIIFYCATITFLYLTWRAILKKEIKTVFLLSGLFFLILPSLFAIIFTAYNFAHHHDGYIFLIFGYFWIGILINLLSLINILIYFFLKKREAHKKNISWHKRSD